MTKVFRDAIQSFLDIADMNELSKLELFQLKKAQEGNAGAFCDLLAAEGYENKPVFNAFYHEVNGDGRDYEDHAAAADPAAGAEVFTSLSDDGKKDADNIRAVLFSFFNSKKIQFTEAELSVFAEEIASESFTVSIRDKTLVTSNPVTENAEWFCSNTPKGRLAFVSDLLETSVELKHGEANRATLANVKNRLEEHCRKLAELKAGRAQDR